MVPCNHGDGAGDGWEMEGREAGGLGRAVGLAGVRAVFLFSFFLVVQPLLNRGSSARGRRCT